MANYDTEDFTVVISTYPSAQEIHKILLKPKLYLLTYRWFQIQGSWIQFTHSCKISHKNEMGIQQKCW
jgi:hypothetical protein